ncbi:unnamed protein product, partial [Choristocarpus tenellus]
MCAQVNTDDYVQTSSQDPSPSCSPWSAIVSPVDVPALRNTLAALLGQARAGARDEVSRRDRLGNGKDLSAAAGDWPNILIVHGSAALDRSLLLPHGFGLTLKEVFALYVD